MLTKKKQRTGFDMNHKNQDPLCDNFGPDQQWQHWAVIFIKYSLENGTSEM